jgi:hypothetical protein
VFLYFYCIVGVFGLIPLGHHFGVVPSVAASVGYYRWWYYHSLGKEHRIHERSATL